MPRLTTTAETAAGLWRHPFTTRSRRLLFPAILLICILLYLLPLPHLPSTPPPPPHVAIINGPRHNFELVWPLLYTFTQQRLRKLDLVAATPSTSRHGILHFLDLSASPKPLSLLPPDRITLDTSWNPDLFVLASCMHDMSSEPHIRYAVERVLTGNPRTTVVCVVNEVHAWKDPKGAHRGFIKKWGKLGRVRFLVLSEHVRKSLRTEIRKWDIGTPEILPVFVPVFPVADATLGFDPELPLRKGLGISVCPHEYTPDVRD